MTTRPLAVLKTTPDSNSSLIAHSLRRAAIGAICVLGFSSVAFASGLPGKYASDSKCKMSVERLDMDAGMSEGWFKIDSEGDGTCTWKGLGVAKGTHLDVAAVVSLSAVLSFADLNWTYGPSGDEVEIVFYDNTGKLINKQTYNRVN